MISSLMNCKRGTGENSSLEAVPAYKECIEKLLVAGLRAAMQLVIALGSHSTRILVMARFLFLLLILRGVGLVACADESFQISLTGSWLREDGTRALNGFVEGDTAVFACCAKETDNRPFDTVQMQWKRYGRSDWEVIADRERILFFDALNRFSNATLATNSQNETEYSIAISHVSRYDSGTPAPFRCLFGVHTASSGEFTRSTVAEMIVEWSPPLPTCSISIPIDSKAQKGDDLSYYCTVTDVDGNSHGSLTLWRGDDRLPVVKRSKTALYPSSLGYVYNFTDVTVVTDRSSQDVYMCRYSATGGFEDYNSNCTFNNLICTVDNLDDPCPVSSAREPRQCLIFVFIAVIIASVVLL